MPFDVKILGIATYVQTSSLLCSDVFSRENCQNSLSEFHPVSIDLSLEQGMFEERLPLCIREEHLIALDETVVKANKKEYYVYSAVDVENKQGLSSYKVLRRSAKSSVGRNQDSSLIKLPGL